jgi:hypothetical protein
LIEVIGVRYEFDSSCLELAIQYPKAKYRAGAHHIIYKTALDSFSSYFGGCL